MVEVWQIIENGLVDEDLVDDVRSLSTSRWADRGYQILYSMPLSEDRVEDLNDAWDRMRDSAVLRLMVDHPEQIKALERIDDRLDEEDRLNTHRQNGRKWSIFIKVDGGGR